MGIGGRGLLSLAAAAAGTGTGVGMAETGLGEIIAGGACAAVAAGSSLGCSAGCG